MIKIGLIPLDSRPCNTQWIKDFTQISAYELITYPFEKCGNLFQGASLDEQILWLEANFNDLDYLIISSDGLTFGGLVQARLGRIDLELAKSKLDIIKTLKKRNPKLKIYVFDTFMRTTITAYDSRTAYYWSKVNEYSLYKGRVHFYNDENDKRKLEELEATIPHDIIETYVNARKIKHEINKYFLDLTFNDYIDYMVILQEDAMPYGIQKIEQTIIDGIISKSSKQDKVMIYNGTDEGGAILLAKAILDASQTKPNIYVLLPHEKVLDHIMLFEDRPFSVNLEKMFETIHLTRVNDVNQADFILAIYAEDENKDCNLSTMDEVLPKMDDNYHKFIKQLNHYINDNKRVCFTDLLFPNGGSDVILKAINYLNLTCYSAWNTASNTMGTALANIVAYIVGEKNNPLFYQSLNAKFNKERILDDCLYQYIVRREFNSNASKLGMNPYNLGDSGEEVRARLEANLKVVAKPYLEDNFDLILPWNRTFEALITIRGKKDE